MITARNRQGKMLVPKELDLTVSKFDSPYPLRSNFHAHANYGIKIQVVFPESWSVKCVVFTYLGVKAGFFSKKIRSGKGYFSGDLLKRNTACCILPYFLCKL